MSEPLSVSEIASLFHEFEPTTPAEPLARRSARRTSNPALAFMCSNACNAQTGVRKERVGIDRYSQRTGRVVTQRNEKNLLVPLQLEDRLVELTGRPDGLCEAEGIVVEHKYRVHGLLPYVPFHEIVQCHLYMHMTQTTRAHLVQSFGNHFRVHEIPFSAATWRRICEAIRCGRDLHQISSPPGETRAGDGGDPPAKAQ